MLDVRTKSTAAPASPRKDECLPCGVDSLVTVAHELRGPLATVLYALGAIRADVNPATRRSLAIAERQTWRAARIVDDLFDVCAGSRGQLALRREAVDIAEIVTWAAEAARHVFETQGQRLTVSLPAEPASVFADPLRLEQVLANLLGNAAIFSFSGGEIGLSARTEAGQIVIRVRDNGRGIAPDLLPRVFDPFRQGPQSAHRGSGGLGIGLALVKSLVELHGGRVEVASEGLGLGSVFAVYLPRADG